MASYIRTTVYLKPAVYRALKTKAATTDRSVSDLVNAAVLESLREDALDLEAFHRRAKEPSILFEKVGRLKALSGKLHLDFDWTKQERAELRHEASLRRRRHGHR